MYMHDRLGVWEGYHESRRCLRDIYPESHVTKHTSARGYFYMCVYVHIKYTTRLQGSSETTAKRRASVGDAEVNPKTKT